MSKEKVYINYSGPTDITGQKLENLLKISGGRDTLKAKGKVELVIGWGAKTKNARARDIAGIPWDEECQVPKACTGTRLDRHQALREQAT